MQCSPVSLYSPDKLIFQLAKKMGLSVAQISNVIIWGNHSGTQYPDARHASVLKGDTKVPLTDVMSDDAWLKSEFISVSLLVLDYTYK